jgi:hypothetical protein
VDARPTNTRSIDSATVRGFEHQPQHSYRIRSIARQPRRRFTAALADTFVVSSRGNPTKSSRLAVASCRQTLHS